VPEGDSIHQLAARLRPVLAAQPLVRVELARPSRSGLRPPGPGTLVEAVEAQGKHLLIRFEGGIVLRTHLRMNGSWQLYRPGERWHRPRHRMRALVSVAGHDAVCFDAPVVELERRPATGHLGPDLAGPDPDLERCVERLGTLVDPATPVADALLDQRIACGVGNVFKSEVCFACGVDPATAVGALDPAVRAALVATAARLLRANLGPGPRTTVRGGPGALAVYGRAGRPCRRCGTRIRVQRLGVHARATFWCPTCQPPPAEPD
jgi:endonuclease VIII